MPKETARVRGRFSVLYFAIIYIYTLAFSLLETIPFLESLLSHLPQPHHLVSDTYQPISDRAAAPRPSSFSYSSAVAHEADAADTDAELAESMQRPQLLRRRRASSTTSSAASSPYLRPTTQPPSHLPADEEPAASRHAARSPLQHHRSGANQSPAAVAAGSAALRTAKKKTLVLDLDETLIHSSPQGSYRAHHRIEVVIDKVACLYYVYKRPHVDYFLRRVSEWYKVVVFTASLAEYADPVIDLLDSQNKLIEGRYFRESCVPHDSSYAKDLAAIDPDLSQIVLVDNSPLSYFINPTNGIPIQPWVNSDPKDEALLDLLPLLDALRFTDDVRSILSLRLV
ncbi:Nuclear envelope morphology protein 1 [Coemansia sp. RSA 2320]|nr:Nuclear envelope morphology protein 1 [Coemansia sp. RSA 2320]